MDTISVSVLRNNLAQVLEQVEATKKFFVIKSRGRNLSVLVNLDLFEDLVAQSSDQYIKSIKLARKEAQEDKVLTLDEAFGEL